MDDFMCPEESFWASTLSHEKANLSWQNQDRKLYLQCEDTVLGKINFPHSYSLQEQSHLRDILTDEAKP